MGYAVRPGERGGGYGTLLLFLLLRECGRLGMEKVLLTIHKGNPPSLKAALANHGMPDWTSDRLCYIWTVCPKGGEDTGDSRPHRLSRRLASAL